MRLVLLTTLVVALAVPRTTVGAEIVLTRNGISISGPIARGDYGKFAAFVIDPAYPERFDAFLIAINLDSPGGDVAEAMKIASLLDQSFAQTFVRKGALCASACFLMWAAGVIRVNAGTLGVHRLSLASSSTDVRQTERAVFPAAQTVETFLVKMGIPHRILDKMRETAPSDIFVISNRWLLEEDLSTAVLERPIFLDVAEKKCGTSPYTAGVRTNTMPSREEYNAWGRCADTVRSQNQSMHMKEIIDSLVKASIFR